MIVERIKESILFGAVIPKPEAKADFVVKGWGNRRAEPALIYLIPNHGDASKPHQKGITESEFEMAFSELVSSGTLTRRWFNQYLSNCAKEGACNFTTIGGIFELLGEAAYSGRGVYELRTGAVR
jgi:hypothetical protein